MKKTILSLIIALWLVGGDAVAGELPSVASSTTPAAVFEGGSLFKAGKIDVIDLHGPYRRMGRQYGHLLRDRLQRLYRAAVEEHFIGRKGLSRDMIEKTAEGLFRLYPRRFRDVIEGMSETSGLTLEQQIQLNAIELYGTLPGCSGIFAWGEYTGGGPLVAGRNYDWFDSYVDFARSLAVTVFHPDSGIPFSIVTFAGVIYATTGLNSQGLFLELNNGLPSGGALAFDNRVPAIVNLMAFLTDCGTMDQLDAAFHTTRSNFAFIVNVADNNAAWAYEWPPFDLRRRTGASEGLLVSTNHFADPSWGIAFQANTGFMSILRRDNLLALGEKHRGEIQAETMMRILDTRMDEGGATWPDKGGIRTVYQVVAVPGELKLWVKIRGWQEWNEIDLARIFAVGE